MECCYVFICLLGIISRFLQLLSHFLSFRIHRAMHCCDRFQEFQTRQTDPFAKRQRNFVLLNFTLENNILVPNNYVWVRVFEIAIAYISENHYDFHFVLFICFCSSLVVVVVVIFTEQYEYMKNENSVWSNFQLCASIFSVITKIIRMN